jgi:uncharacterized membrane protein YbhN (UPF0104 family)
VGKADVPEVLGFTECMGSRERFLELVSTISKGTSTRRAQTVSQLLLLAALLFVGLRLRTIWQDSRSSLTHVDWSLLVGAATLSACGVTAASFVWLAVLRQLGVRVESWFTGIFFQAQLAKYIPGSVWQYAGRAALGRSVGLPARPVVVSSTLELLAVATSGASLGLLAAGKWGAAVAVVIAGGAVLLLLSSFGKRGISQLLGLVTRLHSDADRFARGFAVGTALYIPVWLVMGVAFWLMARAFFDVPIADLPYDIGSFSLAWFVGLVAFFAPGGLGVREAVLVAMLRSRLGTADAFILAAVSRATFTVIDVVAAGVGALILSRSSGPGRLRALSERKT